VAGPNFFAKTHAQLLPWKQVGIHRSTILTVNVIFEKLLKSKQLPIRQKFAQSGRPNHWTDSTKLCKQKTNE
jgi:hypothetical protein